MKRLVKLILPIVFIIFVYATLYNCLKDPSSFKLVVSIICSIVFGIINIGMALNYTLKKDKDTLLLIGSLIKSLMVFGYISIFLLALGITTLLTVFIGPFSLLFVIPAVIIDVFVLVVSSCYIIGYLIVDYKENNDKKNIIHGILQFIFVLDVFDMLYLCFFKEKKFRAINLIIIIVSIIAPFFIIKLI